MSSGGFKRKILLRGEMGERFGREWELDVATPAEAIRAIDANRPGFREWLRDCDGNTDFAVLLGGDAIDETHGDHPMGRRSLEFVPVVRGAGGNGTVGIILGVILIAAAVLLTWGAAVPGILAAQTFLGTYLAATTFTLGAIGVSLVLGGVSSLIAGTPKTLAVDRERQQDPEKLPSYQFSGPVNVTGQGNPVPIIYGEMIVGSLVVSMGLQSS